MGNRNSFAENLAELTKNTESILEIANGMNAAMTGNDTEVIVNENIVLPSFSNVTKRLERVENTVSKFVQGKGVVEIDDGSYRTVKTDLISHPADTITGLPAVTEFGINPNWFFELLQYPRCIVNIDLKGKIDDSSDRAYVNRIIIDSTQDALYDNIKSEILNSTLEYADMIAYLNGNRIEYKEDRDEVKLPLTYEKYKGVFRIISAALIQNASGVNETWYYLSSINYSTVDEDGNVMNDGHILTEGDKLRFGDNSMYSISEINQVEKRVRLSYDVGFETPGEGDYFEFYNTPFSEKIISVGIGINEIDIVYVKGVNENYNLLSREWSNPVTFFTNDLVFEQDGNESFLHYYQNNVADFGKEWISQAKEHRVYSYDGLTPNKPVVNESDIRVVQINTQLNATLDNERYTQLTSEIASVKSNITATRNVVATNKDKLVQETDSNSRETIQNTINSNTEKLNNLTTQFSSLVEELNTLLTDAGVINYSPKYHVRGFFSIPDAKYAFVSGDTKLGKQSIIGFETMYRYLHTDNTGVELSTFNYTNTSTGIVENAVFSDWNLKVSQFLEKRYNEVTGEYEWSDTLIDGTQITINQIDIPIRKGEKVEMKIRSVSEAGYPYNPIKSSWSDSVIVGFPDNLTSDDSVTTILDTVRDDMTSVVLQETLSAAGIYTHMSDSNSKYKHNAEYIEYTETITDSSGNTTVVTMSVADKLRSLSGTTANTDEDEVAFTFPSIDSSVAVISLPSDKLLDKLKVSDASTMQIREKAYEALLKAYENMTDKLK